jgi:DNA-binding IscR family transcriptional regulator
MSNELADGLWLSISEIARLKGKSRQAIAKRVAPLVAHGLLDARLGKNGTKLINLAQFDRAVGEVGDAIKEGAAETRAEIEADEAPASPALRDHQARAAQYAADLKFLDLEERLGRLVPVAEVEDAAAKCAEATVRIIDRLPTYADSIASAVGKDGPAGARAKLKDIARELRNGIAEAHGQLARKAEPMALGPADFDEADGYSAK